MRIADHGENHGRDSWDVSNYQATDHSNRDRFSLGRRSRNGRHVYVGNGEMRGDFMDKKEKFSRLQVHNFPAELHDTLKIMAIKSGMTLADFIKKILREFVENTK